MCGDCTPGWGCVSPQSGRTPLMWASHFGHVDIVRMLLDRGASMDATDDVSNQGSCSHCCRTASPVLAAVCPSVTANALTPL